MEAYAFMNPKNAISGKGLSSLEATLKKDASKGLPPVDLWNPPYCGDIGLKIAADGTWFYQESPIGRQPLVKLFSSVLRKDDDGAHYLVTPVEKIAINVEDAPFLAVEMIPVDIGLNQILTFRTNVDDEVVIDLRHPLRFDLDPTHGGLKPYILVRGRLEALVTRALYYDLVELAEINEVDGVPTFGVWSSGHFFSMARAEDLEIR